MSSQLLGRIGVRAILLGLSTFCGSLAAQTSDPPPPERGNSTVPVYVEYDKRIRASEQLSALGSDLFGDQVSLYTGQTSYRHVDIDIPGNSELPVQLSRRYTIAALTDGQRDDPRGGPGNPYGGLANWDIEVPHIYGTFDETFKWNIPATSTTQQPRCSQFFSPRRSSPALDIAEIWSGNKVVIPGKGEKELLLLNPSYPPLQYPSDGRPATWTTSDFDAFKCINLTGTNNEGFIMTTRAGVSYRFDKYFERTYSTVGSGNFTNARVAVFLLASRVTDRHGNWVDYTYNADGHPVAITASDGRAIALTYAQQRLQSASVTVPDPLNPGQPPQIRTWTYGYASDNLSDNLPRLTTVTLPDNLSTWQFDYRALNVPDPKSGRYKYLYVKYVTPDPSGKECGKTEVDGSGAIDFGLRITHPSGSRGDFRFAFERANRFPPENLPNCDPRPGGGRYDIPPHMDAFRIKSKQIFDTDTTSSLWAYDYDTLPVDKRVRTIITSPDGSEIHHDFSAAAKVTVPNSGNVGLPIEGQLVRMATLQGGNVLREQTNTYVTGADTPSAPLAGYPFPSIYGVGSGGDPSANSLRPLLSTQIVQQGVRFKRENLTFDTLGRPLEVKRESSLVAGGAVLNSKIETTAFDDKRSTWVLDLVDTLTNSALPVAPMIDNDYDAVGNLTRVAEFNREQRGMTWRPDGTLATLAVGPHTTTIGTFDLAPGFRTPI